MPLVFPSGTSSHPKNALQKRKLEIKVLLVLHVLIPGVMLSSLETINPWLSACDLRHRDVPDAPDAACAAAALPPPSPHPSRPLCPDECSPSEMPAKTNSSCLAYLNGTRRNAICNFNLGNGIEWLKSFLGTIRLRYCCEYKIIESLSASLLERVLRGKDECFHIIDSLVEVDNLAQRLTCEFSEVLTRYDCRQPYSVKFSCDDCLEAYRRWVCSTLVPYHNDSVRIRPCRSVCQAVEQKCPYFLPENRAPSLPTQYAGEPTFLCMDPNIPEVGEQQRRSLYPDDSTCCVKICGSLKDGLCVEKGSRCKSEELISYEEALDQVVDCAAADSIGTRVPNLECTASEPYSSPHKLGSGGRRTLPRAALVLLPACLYPRCCPLLLLCALDMLLNLLRMLPPALLDLGRRRRCRAAVEFLSDFVKRPLFVCNRRRFGSYKWQYYFILISVNLFVHLFTITPQPLTTPPFLFDVFTKSNETRSASRYYYYYYYYYFYYNYYYRCKNYYTILSRIAQRSNVALNWERRKWPFATVKTTGDGGKNSSSVINDSLTINRVKESRRIYKIIITSIWGSRRRFSRGRTRESDTAPAVGARVARFVARIVAEAFARARARVASSRTDSAGSILGSARRRRLNHVSGVTSFSKCWFQTLR